MMSYLTLFFSAFLAATLFPAQSEAVLAVLLLDKHYSVAGLIAVASLGNILGSIVNWLLGRMIEHCKGKRWFLISEKQLDRAVIWYQRYGRWSLLLSWVPFIGDPLTVVAGMLREKFWVFVSIVAVAKIARYLVVAAVVL